MVLCTGPDARCDSKMVMATGLGVRGQYHCWIWTCLFSCMQDMGPCQSSCPLHQPYQATKTMSGVTEEVSLSLQFTSLTQTSFSLWSFLRAIQHQNNNQNNGWESSSGFYEDKQNKRSVIICCTKNVTTILKSKNCMMHERFFAFWPIKEAKLSQLLFMYILFFIIFF